MWGKWWKYVGTSENVSIMNCVFISGLCYYTRWIWSLCWCPKINTNSLWIIWKDFQLRLTLSRFLISNYFSNGARKVFQNCNLIISVRLFTDYLLSEEYSSCTFSLTVWSLLTSSDLAAPLILLFSQLHQHHHFQTLCLFFNLSFSIPFTLCSFLSD